jgi:hypothetical protein
MKKLLIVALAILLLCVVGCQTNQELESEAINDESSHAVVVTPDGEQIREETARSGASDASMPDNVWTPPTNRREEIRQAQEQQSEETEQSTKNPKEEEDSKADEYAISADSGKQRITSWEKELELLRETEDQSFMDWVAEGNEAEEFPGLYVQESQNSTPNNEPITIFEYYRRPSDPMFYSPGIMLADRELSASDYGTMCVIALELARKQVEDEADAVASLVVLEPTEYSKFDTPLAYYITEDYVLILNLKLKVDYTRSQESKFVYITVPMSYNGDGKLSIHRY